MKNQKAFCDPDPKITGATEKAEKMFERDASKLDEENFFRAFDRNRSHPARTLLAIYKGNYGRLLLAFLFHLIKTSPCFILPIVTAHVINVATASGEHPLSDIYVAIGFLIVLLLQNILTNYLYQINISKSTRLVESGLRAAMVRKLQQLSISFHHEMQSGRIQSKIMRDVETVESLSTQLIGSAVGIVGNFIFAMCVTASKNVIVLLFFLMAVPVAVLIMRLFRRRIQTQNAAFRQGLEMTSASVMEMVEMVPVTKAHALESVEETKISSELNRVASRGYALDITQSFFGSISWVVFQVFQVICLAFTGTLAYKGEIEVGDVSLYQSYFTSMIGQLNGILGLIPIIAKGLESVNSIGDIMLANQIESDKGKIRMKSLEGRYEFEDVCFHYDDAPERNILNHLSLSVKKGETIALVGESGSGKSTILNLVIGFFMPSSGRVTVDGKDLTKINLHDYRSHIAVVPQNSILFSGTIRENITYGLNDVTEEQLWAAVRAANLEEMISRMPEGIDTAVAEHGSNLSGGQRQRISIARAIIRNPSVIVLDEATSALDSVSEKLIQNAIENLCADRTTFIVAHRLSTIRNADRIAVIREGVCVECGTYDELMEKQGEFFTFKKLQS